MPAELLNPANINIAISQMTFEANPPEPEEFIISQPDGFELGMGILQDNPPINNGEMSKKSDIQPILGTNPVTGETVYLNISNPPDVFQAQDFQPTPPSPKEYPIKVNMHLDEKNLEIVYELENGRLENPEKICIALSEKYPDIPKKDFIDVCMQYLIDQGIVLDDGSGRLTSLTPGTQKLSLRIDPAKAAFIVGPYEITPPEMQEAIKKAADEHPELNLKDRIGGCTPGLSLVGLAAGFLLLYHLLDKTSRKATAKVTETADRALGRFRRR